LGYDKKQILKMNCNTDISGDRHGEEHTKAALETEPGVLTLYAMTQKQHPSRVTVLEIYAGNEAYQAHLKTAHFLKYKTETQKMVKSLELVDVAPIAFGTKPDILDSEN
jgi:4-carboxymuconolactone decarboxylase